MTDNPQPQQDEPREKKKNDEREVEFSFDFANLGNSVRNLLNSMAGDEEVKTETLAALLNDAQSARVNIDFSVGEAALHALESGSDHLIKAELTYVGEVDFIDTGDAERSITLKQQAPKGISGKPLQQGLRALADRENLRWDVQLSPDVPLMLDVDGGVGPSKLDLTGLQVASLEADTGVGTLTLTLPAQEKTYDAEIDGGVGQTRIYIPDGASVMLDIDGGVGAVEIVVPPNAAVQLQATSGLGAINVPPSFVRRSKKQDFLDQGGVWQTEGYELAEQRIGIYYDGGVGQLTVREAEII